MSELLQKLDKQEQLIAEMAVENAELKEALREAEHFLVQIDPVHWPSKREARRIIGIVRAALASPAAELSRANEIELNGVRKFQEYMREQTKLFGGDVGTAMLDAILTNYIQAQSAPVAQQLDIEDQLKEAGHD